MAVKTSKLTSRIAGKVGQVLDLDLGWEALMQTVERLQTQTGLEAGVIGSEADKPHPSSKTGETIGQIAAKHEFGIGVPERSFLRSTFEANKREYQGLLSKGLVDEIIESVRRRRPYNPESAVALKRLALRMEGDVKQRIARGIPPPNSPRTIRRKGSSTPLIDTGALRQAVGAVVRKGKRK